ncbi:unnamed protein product [Miscanthus lutarioriparius]|uniref:Uncharacterized protein n=1 Tax=Miscanthus lutarioriparius TaxID=422564 RepID=A0A811S4C3_9POAL|nr:unnamed protein product [Miscanthus lutarioriparius]
MEDHLNLLFAFMEGKDITRLIATGWEQLAYACSGAADAVVTAAAAAATKGEEEAKKEEDEEDVGIVRRRTHAVAVSVALPSQAATALVRHTCVI